MFHEKLQTTYTAVDRHVCDIKSRVWCMIALVSALPVEILRHYGPPPYSPKKKKNR